MSFDSTLPASADRTWDNDYTALRSSGDAMSSSDLQAYGLVLLDGQCVAGSLVYERPAFVHEPRRLKDCSLGAFALINGQGTTSLYRTRIGRYGQVGESCVVGPPEHPQDWFSNHPFAFSRPEELPKMYLLPDFVRLAPDGSEPVHYTKTVTNETWIGHEAYVGAGSFVRRGVRIGDGAVVGAGSIVTQDVPDYAIVVGTPARVIRMRFPDPIIERFLALQWWRYDLAPFKHAVDFSRVEATLEYFEERKAAGQLAVLCPDTYRVVRRGGAFTVEEQADPLYFV